MGQNSHGIIQPQTRKSLYYGSKQLINLLKIHINTQTCSYTHIFQTPAFSLSTEPICPCYIQSNSQVTDHPI